MQVTRPAFLDFNGPVPEELGKVSLPQNFETLSPDDQREAKALQQAHALHNLYMARCFSQILKLSWPCGRKTPYATSLPSYLARL